MTDKLRESISIFGDRPCYKCGSYNCDMSCEAALAKPTVQKSLTVAEPVGWLHWLTVDGERFPQLTLMPRTDKDEPLYTALPRREWVGLTKEEVKEISSANHPWVVDIVVAVEAKLKEKTHDQSTFAKQVGRNK